MDVNYLRIIEEDKESVIVKPYESVMDLFIEHEKFEEDNKTIEVF